MRPGPCCSLPSLLQVFALLCNYGHSYVQPFVQRSENLAEACSLASLLVLAMLLTVDPAADATTRPSYLTALLAVATLATVVGLAVPVCVDKLQSLRRFVRRKAPTAGPSAGEDGSAGATQLVAVSPAAAATQWFSAPLQSEPPANVNLAQPTA